MEGFGAARPIRNQCDLTHKVKKKKYRLSLTLTRIYEVIGATFFFTRPADQADRILEHHGAATLRLT